MLKEKEDEEGFIEEGSTKEEGSTQEESRTVEEEDCQLIVVPAWDTKLVDEEQRVVGHEGRYFRAGKVGVLCVDGVGPKLRRTLGEEGDNKEDSKDDSKEDNNKEEDQDPIGEPQFQFIEEQLKVNSSKHPIKVLVVVLHNPLTGRRNNDPKVT